LKKLEEDHLNRIAGLNLYMFSNVNRHSIE